MTFDFWDQVGQAERLEELRLYRPAAYQALPKEPRLAARDSGLEKPESVPDPGPRAPGPDHERPEGAPR